MTKFVKTLAFMFAITFLAYPSSAKVVHLNDVNNLMFMGSDNMSDLECDSSLNQYKTQPANTTCEKLPNGCLQCSCDTTKYKYTCKETHPGAFVGVGDSCNIDGGDPKYAKCKCNTEQRFLSLSEIRERYTSYVSRHGITDIAQVFNLGSSLEYNHEDSSDDVTCYKSDGFTCINGAEFTLRDVTSSGVKLRSDGGEYFWRFQIPIEPLEYVLVSNLPYSESSTDGNIKFCIVDTGISRDFSRVAWTSNSNLPDCVKVAATTSRYMDTLGRRLNYLYATGDCADSCKITDQNRNPCLGVQNRLIYYYDVNSYNIKDMTCRKPVSSCLSGVVVKDEIEYLCITTKSTNLTGVNATLDSIENGDYCAAISGCDEVNSYEQYNAETFGSADSAIEVKRAGSAALNNSPAQLDLALYNTEDSDGKYPYILCTKVRSCKTAFNGAPVCDITNAQDGGLWKDFLSAIKCGSGQGQ